MSDEAAGRAAVADSSPPISLSAIGALDVLERLHHEVRIPSAVWREVVVQGEGRPGEREVQAARWIRVVEAQSDRVARIAAGFDLGDGEAEAIALAQESGSPVILDDGAGRRAARSLGLSVTGTLGVLLRARRRGMIGSLREAIQALRDAGKHIDDGIVAAALRAAGE